MDFGKSDNLKSWLLSHLKNIVATNAEHVTNQIYELISSNSSSHIAIIISLVNNIFGEILGEAFNAFIIDLYEFLSNNKPSTFGASGKQDTSSLDLKRKQPVKTEKLKKPKCEQQRRINEKEDLDNWRNIAAELIADYENEQIKIPKSIKFEGNLEEPQPPHSENDFKTFCPTMKDLENFEIYYSTVLLPWSKYYGGVVLKMPKEWLALLPKKPILEDPSLILNTQIQNFTRYNDSIIGYYNQTLDKLESIQNYYNIIVKHDDRNKINNNSNYDDNIKAVKAMLDRGELENTYYASDVDIEYLLKDVANTFNFRNFSNVLRAYANYDNREFPGITKTMGYAGSFGSSSATHFEDFNANALNLHIFGAEKIWKCWRGDLQDDIIKLGESLVNDLKKKHKKNTVVHQSCSAPFLDKKFILSSRVTRENHLPYALIVQKPGDMVVTFPRAYHAVTNAGFNFAVAVNFCFTSFLKDALLYQSCSCNSLNELLPEIVVALKNGASELPNREIEIICSYCNTVLADVHALECHNKTVHFTDTAYSCKFCTTYIQYKNSLRSHLGICVGAKMAKYDPNKAESYFTIVSRSKQKLKPNPNAKKAEKRTHHCTIINNCSKCFESAAKLKDHIRKCHSPDLFKCLNPSCTELFSRKDNMYRHVRKEHNNYIHLIPTKNSMISNLLFSI